MPFPDGIPRLRTITEARGYLREICQAYGVKPCAIAKKSGLPYLAGYYPDTRSIHLNDPTGMQWQSLLHEIAHYFQHLQHGGMPVRWHTKNFFRIKDDLHTFTNRHFGIWVPQQSGKQPGMRSMDAFAIEKYLGKGFRVVRQAPSRPCLDRGAHYDY